MKNVTLSDYIKRLQAIEKHFKSNAELKPYTKDNNNPVTLLLSDDDEGNGYHIAYEPPSFGFIPKLGSRHHVDPDMIFTDAEEAKKMGYTGELTMAIFLWYLNRGWWQKADLSAFLSSGIR